MSWAAFRGRLRGARRAAGGAWARDKLPTQERDVPVLLHGSPPLTVTDEATIARPRNAQRNMPIKFDIGALIAISGMADARFGHERRHHILTARSGLPPGDIRGVAT